MFYSVVGGVTAGQWSFQSVKIMCDGLDPYNWQCKSRISRYTSQFALVLFVMTPTLFDPTESFSERKYCWT